MIAQEAQFADHPCRALSPRPFGYRRAPFLITYLPVEKNPDQLAKPMGNHSDGLIMSHARYLAVIQDLEDASFGPRCGVGSLIENPSHLAIALRGPVAVVHSRALVVPRAYSHPGT